jgi:hypothetical protein
MITSIVIVFACVWVASAYASGLGATSISAAKPTFWETIRVSAKWIAEVIGPILATIAGVGTATMAAQQAVKDVLNLRRNYNRRRIAEWMTKRLAGLGDPAKAAGQLEQLAVSGEGDALYSLESAKLAAQVYAAGRMALDDSEMYTDLLACLLRDASAEDCRIATTRQEPASVAQVEAKTRVLSYMQRAIDGFQIMVDYRWAHTNQVVSLVLNTAVFLFLWLIWSKPPTPQYFLSALVAALLGAFIAPVAKDLVTALQSLKDLKR